VYSIPFPCINQEKKNLEKLVSVLRHMHLYIMEQVLDDRHWYPYVYPVAGYS
jgi:hypothetical protein